MDYEGTCYIGVVGPDTIPNLAVISIMNMQRREGDASPSLIAATKGYEARQQHIDRFMDSEHDFILLLDHDMIFEPDTLEKLRSHKMPYVSGYYMRRRYAPIYSVWYEPFRQWPMRPYLADPPTDELVPLGASGWGCILLHREVIQKTRERVLCGEPDVIEDDMDVWPYDLAKIMRGEERIRPLRGIKSPIGSDIRYPFYAYHAGYQLYGDASVRPRHIANYPITADDFASQSIGGLAGMLREFDGVISQRQTEIADTFAQWEAA